MERLKDLLEECINIFGTSDKVTILVSQKLDKEIVKELRKQ